MRRRLTYILLLLSLVVAAAPNTLKQFLSDFATMDGQVTLVEEEGAYQRVQLNDSASLEMYEADNLIVVLTVCAPQCSSCARVYNKVGEYLFAIEPTVTSVFPLATMDKSTGQISWTDNDTWEY